MSEPTHENVLTLAGSGTGTLPSLHRWVERRVREAELLVHDATADPRLVELASEGCERVSVGAGATEIGIVDPAGTVRAARRAIEEGRSVVRLYGEALLMSENAFEEVRRLADADVAFEAVVGHLYLEERSLDWRIKTLHHGGGLLVLPVRPAGTRGLRESLLGEDPPKGTTCAFLRESPPPGPLHHVAEPEEMDQRLRAEEKAASGLFLHGHGGRTPTAARWFTRLPLLGVRTLVTRAEEDAAGIATLIEERGGEPLSLPTIELGPPEDWGPLDRALEDLEAYDWVVFTSRNGVDGFFDRLLTVGRDARALGGRRLACVGAATAAALHERGFHPDLVPEEYRAEPLAELLRPEAPGRRFLLPRASEARESLPEILQEAGAEVDDLAAYKNYPPPDLREGWDRLNRTGFDAITFTSSSTVRHLAEGLGVQDLGGHLEEKLVVCIGPVTASTARQHGLDPGPLPEESTMEGLVEALVRAI